MKHEVETAVLAGALSAVLVCLLLAFSVWLFAVLWAWTIPDVFGGAVGKGLLPPEITWIQSLKLSLFLMLGVGTLKWRNKG